MCIGQHSRILYTDFCTYSGTSAQCQFRDTTHAQSASQGVPQKTMNLSAFPISLQAFSPTPRWSMFKISLLNIFVPYNNFFFLTFFWGWLCNSILYKFWPLIHCNGHTPRGNAMLELTPVVQCALSGRCCHRDAQPGPQWGPALPAVCCEWTPSWTFCSWHVGWSGPQTA